MATTNIRIKKICEWCGKEFEAQKVSTRFCSDRCAKLAYKQAQRDSRIQTIEAETKRIKQDRAIAGIKDKEFLTFSETGLLLGLTRQAIYKIVKSGLLKASKISTRLSLIKRSDIEDMLRNNPYQIRQPKESVPITEFYTTEEIKQKFGIKDAWVFKIGKEQNIPRTLNHGKTYWSKKHIDAYFAKKAPDASIIEWYTVPEIQEKFGMTLSAIYSFAYDRAIPRKKEGPNTFYSKKHFDIAKGIATPDEPQYYTVAKAMEKFNLTRDQLYHYATYHNIPKIKKGKYVLISKPDLDKLFEPPKIE